MYKFINKLVINLLIIPIDYAYIIQIKQTQKVKKN